MGSLDIMDCPNKNILAHYEGPNQWQKVMMALFLYFQES